MNAPVSIAVIGAGAGAIGRKHAEILAQLDGVRLAAIADPAESAQALAERLGVPHFEGHEQMLRTIRPQGAVIATPTRLHAQASVACGRRGVHMLMEKPIAETVEAARQMTEIARHHDVQLLVGHHRRYNPILRKAREIVQSGQLGDVVAVSGLWLTLKPDSYFDAAHRREPGAGPVLTNLIHDIDNLRHICGEIVEVQAMGSNVRRGYAVEDTAAVVLRFAGGALATLTVSDAAVGPWSWELTSGEHSFYPRTDLPCYFISGSRGALSVPHLELWRYEGEAGWGRPLQRTPIEMEPQDPYVEQLRHFAAVVRGEATPYVTGADATATLRVVRAILDAIATNRRVLL